MKEVYIGGLADGTLNDLKNIIAKESKYKTLDKFLDYLFGGSCVVGACAFAILSVLAFFFHVSTIFGGPISSFFVASGLCTVLGGTFYKLNNSFFMGPLFKKIARAKEDLLEFEAELKSQGLRANGKGATVVMGKHWEVMNTEAIHDNTLYKYTCTDGSIGFTPKTDVDYGLDSSIYGIAVVGGVAFVEMANSWADLQQSDLKLVKSMLTTLADTVCNGFSTNKEEPDIIIDVFNALKRSSELNADDPKAGIVFRYLFRTYSEATVGLFSDPGKRTLIEKTEFVEEAAKTVVERGRIEAYSYRILEEPDFNQLSPKAKDCAESLVASMQRKHKRPIKIVYPS